MLALPRARCCRSRQRYLRAQRADAAQGMHAALNEGLLPPVMLLLGMALMLITLVWNVMILLAPRLMELLDASVAARAVDCLMASHAGGQCLTARK
jgi:hypothetical protein